MAMDEERTEQIIARARQAVADRRGMAHRPGWFAGSDWLLPALVLVVLIAFAVAPRPLPEKLSLALKGVCGLRPSHSYFAGSLQLPLEARLLGMYGGFALTLAFLIAIGRLGARRLSNRATLIVLTLLFAVMVFDGGNSTLSELALPHLYAPTNLLRLLTGVLAGIALAPLLLWLVGAVVLARTGSPDRAVIRSPWELCAPLAMNMLFALIVVQEDPAMCYPITLIGVAGVIGMLAIVALLVVQSVTGRSGRVTQVRQLIAPGSLALLLTFAVLASTAALRP